PPPRRSRAAGTRSLTPRTPPPNPRTGVRDGAMPERRRLMARTKKDRPALTEPVHPQETTQEEPVTNHTTHTTPPLTAYTVDEAMHSPTIAAQDLIHDWSDTRVRGHLKEHPDLVEHRLNPVTQMTNEIRAVVQRERGDGRWGGPLEDIDP